MPDSFDIEFRCSDGIATLVYTEYFTEVEESMFDEVIGMSLQIINMVAFPTNPEIKVDKTNRSVTFRIEAPRQQIIGYIFAELAAQMFRYREEIEKWYSHAINVFPHRPESEKTQVFKAVKGDEEQ